MYAVFAGEGACSLSTSRRSEFEEGAVARGPTLPQKGRRIEKCLWASPRAAISVEAAYLGARGERKIQSYPWDGTRHSFRSELGQLRCADRRADAQCWARALREGPP